ncbi:DgyrCDS9361 [Dimorphilus gyrociliatus]|uniref:DgyrCDS9361 n=1 Tax=Dimorphilus gyrociliatus TaxID=2664684 RepID=A0A7I8W1Z8_9ANNE|nr:DgyrCDS9361 [Dimorphilus gyrociliatus]
MLGKRKNSTPLSRDSCQEPPEKLYVDEQFLCDHLRDITLLKTEKKEVIEEEEYTISISDDVRRQWEKFTRDVLPPRVVEDISKRQSMQMVLWKPLPVDEIASKNAKTANTSQGSDLCEGDRPVSSNYINSEFTSREFFNNNNNHNNNNSSDCNLNHNNNNNSQITNQYAVNYQENVSPMNGISYSEDFYTTSDMNDYQIDDNETCD